MIYNSKDIKGLLFGTQYLCKNLLFSETNFTHIKQACIRLRIVHKVANLLNNFLFITGDIYANRYPYSRSTKDINIFFGIPIMMGYSYQICPVKKDLRVRTRRSTISIRTRKPSQRQSARDIACMKTPETYGKSTPGT